MKILVIRFSSIGDLTQALSIPSLIKSYRPDAEIHFLTRSDFSELLENHPALQKIWKLNNKQGFKGLLDMIAELKKENYTHIYDAHNNLRTFVVRFLLRKPLKLTRPMMRFKRFLLLRFHKNYFEKPFSGQRDLLKPLEKWGFKYFLPNPPQIFLSPAEKEKAKTFIQQNNLKNYIVLVPSAAYVLKRWPIEHWEKLISLHPEKTFLVLAGPNDSFTSVLNQFSQVINLTGKTSLIESAALIERADLVVANDTGLLHIAEQLGRPSIALMGPAPFGFPSRVSTTDILEKELACRPCSKHGQGPCINKNYQECLQSITPEFVSERIVQKLGVSL